MHTIHPRELPPGMPLRLLIAARIIAESGGVAILGRALTFGQLGRHGVHDRVRATAPRFDPSRLPLLSGHPGMSPGPDGPEIAHRIASCSVIVNTPYGLDVLWQLDDNVTAYDRLAVFIADGYSGLSIESPIASRSTQPVYTRHPNRTGRGAGATDSRPVLDFHDVRGLKVESVALVDRPAYPGARIAAVLTAGAAFIPDPDTLALVGRWDDDGTDPDSAATRALWPLVEARTRALQAGSVQAVQTFVGSTHTDDEHGNTVEGHIIDRTAPHAPAIGQLGSHVNERGDLIEYGPVMPFGP